MRSNKKNKTNRECGAWGWENVLDIAIFMNKESRPVVLVVQRGLEALCAVSLEGLCDYGIIHTEVEERQSGLFGTMALVALEGVDPGHEQDSVAIPDPEDQGRVHTPVWVVPRVRSLLGHRNRQLTQDLALRFEEAGGGRMWR